jgi:ornithine carbamoyltransferase
MTRHFLTVDDLSVDELHGVIHDGARLAADRSPTADLAGRTVALLFEKPSTRTRLSFHVAVAELGGTPLPLSGSDLQLGRGETIEDTARVLSGYVHAIALRTFGQERLERLASGSSIPVINALSNEAHPCQALADLLTLYQRFGDLAGRTLAYVGDGNNVAHSLARAGAMVGMHVVIATPVGCAPDPGVIDHSRTLGAASGGTVTVTSEPRAAVAGADAVYTDVWTSMGFEDAGFAGGGGGTARREGLLPFQVNAELMSAAPAHAVAMHCLPAHRAEEITAEVIDGPASVVWRQAENRLHAQKALLRLLVGTPRTARDRT